MAEQTEHADEPTPAEEPEGSDGGIREGLSAGAREMREGVSRDRIESRLDDTASGRPLMRHLLDLKVVLSALLIAAVITIIVSLLLSPRIGAVVLVIGFFIAWYALASRQYNRRKPTKAVDDDEDAEEG